MTNHTIIIWSFVFGVLIDLDELYTLSKFWRETKSWKKFKKVAFKRGIKRRTWFQESGSLVISFIISIFLKSFAPFLCNLTHCMMDWLTDSESTPLAPFYNGYKRRGFIKSGSLEEILIIITLLFILFFVIS
ncbi:MAG: hypothetical protein ISS48_00175 [Candidatus Aenigmarchaeota archaeon]|nr:hypothetical protein [Candidatus Aenigmarchaeota archaeon]